MEIDTSLGLLGYWEAVGGDVLDPEIAAWIAMGEFDEAVVERAEALGWVAPTTPYSERDNPLFSYQAIQPITELEPDTALD